MYFINLGMWFCTYLLFIFCFYCTGHLSLLSTLGAPTASQPLLILSLEVFTALIPLIDALPEIETAIKTYYNLFLIVCIFSFFFIFFDS